MRRARVSNFDVLSECAPQSWGVALGSGGSWKYGVLLGNIDIRQEGIHSYMDKVNGEFEWDMFLLKWVQSIIWVQCTSGVGWSSTFFDNQGAKRIGIGAYLDQNLDLIPSGGFPDPTG